MIKKIFSIEEYYKKMPFITGYLKKIEYVKDFSNIQENSLELELQSIDYLTIKLKFTNVSNMKLKNIECLFLLQLDIENLKNYQMENTNFLIIDSENDIISFYCDEVFIYTEKCK